MKEKIYSAATNRTIDEIIKITREDLSMCMEDCNSPIEQLMALSLNTELRSYRTIHVEPRLGIEIIEIRNQEEVITQSGKVYIPDFSIPVIDVKGPKTSGKMFAIECDGHDFHEKTKEQATHDKQRERDLIAEGYIVIRFSDSEIYRNPFKCASEVFDIIFKYFRKRPDSKAEG